jgi:hypothetical protein
MMRMMTTRTRLRAKRKRAEGDAPASFRAAQVSWLTAALDSWSGEDGERLG